MSMEIIPLVQNAKLPVEVDQMIADVMRFYGNFESPVITDSSSKEIVIDGIKTIKTNYKALEAKQSEILTPIKLLQEKIRAKFRPALEALSNAETISKRRVLDYSAEQERIAKASRDRQQAEENAAAEAKRQAILAQAEAETIFGDAAEAKALVDVAAAIQPATIGEVVVKTKGQKMIKKFRIINKELVPEFLKMVDEVKVGQLVRSAENIKDVNIPGIEAYEEPILAV